MKNIVFLLLLLFIFPKAAHAYLNPGSGSYFLQLIIGLGLGLMFTVKVFWKNIKEYLRRFFDHPSKHT